MVVYLVAAAVSAATGVFFLLFSQHDVQPWNYPQCHTGNNDEVEKGTTAKKIKRFSLRHPKKSIMTVLQKARMYTVSS